MTKGLPSCMVTFLLQNNKHLLKNAFLLHPALKKVRKLSRN